MAATFGAIATNTGSGTSASVSDPGGTSGKVLLMTIASGTTAPTTPTGWTIVGTYSGWWFNSRRFYSYTRTGDGTSTDHPSVTVASGSWEMAIVVVEGGDTSDPVAGYTDGAGADGLTADDETVDDDGSLAVVFLASTYSDGKEISTSPGSHVARGYESQQSFNVSTEEVDSGTDGGGAFTMDASLPRPGFRTIIINPAADSGIEGEADLAVPVTAEATGELDIEGEADLAVPVTVSATATIGDDRTGSASLSIGVTVAAAAAVALSATASVAVPVTAVTSGHGPNPIYAQLSANGGDTSTDSLTITMGASGGRHGDSVLADASNAAWYVWVHANDSSNNLPDSVELDGQGLTQIGSVVGKFVTDNRSSLWRLLAPDLSGDLDTVVTLPGSASEVSAVGVMLDNVRQTTPDDGGTFTALNGTALSISVGTVSASSILGFATSPSSMDGTEPDSDQQSLAFYDGGGTVGSIVSSLEADGDGDGDVDIDTPGFQPIEGAGLLVYGPTSSSAIEGTASLSVGVTVSATAEVDIAATASASVPVTASATGVVGVTGTASLSVPVTVSGDGTGGISASASLAVPFSASATGGLSIEAAASGAIPVTASAAGTLDGPSGSAALAVPVVASATGELEIQGTTSLSIPVVGASTGESPIEGSGAGAIPTVVTATGELLIEGAASSSIPVVVSAVGASGPTGSASLSIPVAASGTGALGIAATASGPVGVTASTTGTVSLAGSASGGVAVTASAVGELSVAATAANSVPVTVAATSGLDITATAAFDIPFTASAVGGTAAPAVPLALVATFRSGPLYEVATTSGERYTKTHRSTKRYSVTRRQ